MRATGRLQGNPAAEQAEGPPTNPVEMGLPIPLVRSTAFPRPPIALCSRPSGARRLLRLRGLARRTSVHPAGTSSRATIRCRFISARSRPRPRRSHLRQLALAISGYEVSAEVRPFTSKFDSVHAGQVQFTEQEQQGYDVFRGKAQCNHCHRDGGPGEEPLFTDFTASNIGTPANPKLPYDEGLGRISTGYVANPAGRVIR